VWVLMCQVRAICINASAVGNHVCDRCWIMASCTNIVLVVSKHDDLVLGALAVDKQQASLADEI
jgi:hypothetical protein